jgi:DNA-binding transcriptional ArsR family regulator
MVSVCIEMNVDPDFASAAALLADPSRSAILARLLDGRSWTATELAKAAGIAPSTGSSHLARLLEHGWVQVLPQGRHRYFSLAGEPVAAFLERFAFLAPAPRARTPGEQRASLALRRCRLCYDHLAGRVGVALTRRLVELQWLTPSFQLTGPGRRCLAAAGLETDPGDGRGCMDWSERRLHLAGPPGRDLAAGMLRQGWFQRDPGSRSLRVTPLGQERLEALLGLDCLGLQDPMEGEDPVPRP